MNEKPKIPKLISEEEARERLHAIIVRGKIMALETGLATGAILPGYARKEAAAILEEYPNLPEETKKRLTALMSTPDHEGGGPIL